MMINEKQVCFLLPHLHAINSISLSRRYLEFRIFTRGACVVMASNFVLPDNFHASHWIMFFQKGSIQGNPSKAILLGLNCGVRSTMIDDDKGCSVLSYLRNWFITEENIFTTSDN